MGNDTKLSVTYESLYDILLREKQRDALQPLAAGFWADALAYLREKQAMLESTRNKVDLFSATEREKIYEQIKHIKQILKEIYNRREKKIVDTALNKSRTGSKIIDTGNQIGVEKQMFDAFVNEMNFFRQGLLNNVIDMREPNMWIGERGGHEANIPEPPVQAGMTPIKMLAGVEQFVGPELDVYGPYKEGDTTSLPSEIANILINQGSAVAESASIHPQTEDSGFADQDVAPLSDTEQGIEAPQ